MPPAWCVHQELSPVDDDGKAVCATCGTVIQVRLTRAWLDETFKLIHRDLSPFGRHSLRCVDTHHGWVCADDCTTKGAQ